MSSRPNTPLPARSRHTIVALAVVTLLAALAGPVSAATSTYYVDCSAGSDSATGRSASLAWRTLTKANSASLVAGDSLLLKRGCTWTGPLNLKWSGTTTAPITVDAYGSGALPKIQNGHENVMITGSHLLVQNIWTRSDVPAVDTGCQNQPMGWRVGFRFSGSASYNTVRYSRADEQYMGFLIEATSHHNKILNNTLRNNNMKDPNPSSDAGAVGINLMGNDNEVGYNDISGSDACSRFYGRDGAAVEVYGGQRNLIHHNKAADNNNFTELGKPPSSDNTYAYNRVTSTLTASNFLVTRGTSAGNGRGPVYRTKFYNNTIYLSGSASYGLQCDGGCNAGILSFKNNIVWVQDRVGYADNSFDESNNVYWKSDGAPKVYFSISSSSKKQDPRFANLGAGDFHLTSSSPAVDAGSTAALSLGFNKDLDGLAVPQAAMPDDGVYERPSGIPTPTPTPPTPTPTPPPTPTPTPGTVTSVSDGFTRTVSSGWSSAATGGPYTLLGNAADFNVNGSLGTILLVPSATRAATLATVAMLDATATVRLKVDRVAGGAGTYAYVVARQTSDLRNAYKVKLWLMPDRGVYLGASRVAGGGETLLGTDTSAGFTYSANTYVWLKMQVTGINPTTIRAKAWPDGQAEPSAWTTVATDSTAALQLAGDVGLRGYNSNTASSATTLMFDYWQVTQ